MTSNDLGFESLLKLYHSKYNLVYKANPGNAGDGVIASATYDFFKQSGLNYDQYRASSHYDSSKDILIFGGGGNLIEGLYAEGKDFIQNQKDKFAKIIIMPSTVRAMRISLKRVLINLLFVAEKEHLLNIYFH